MNGHYRHPMRFETQAIMPADLRVRELHRWAAERQLAARAAAAEQPVQARWLRLPDWLGLPWRAAMRTAAPAAQ
jgi:hypothetical protein